MLYIYIYITSLCVSLSITMAQRTRKQEREVIAREAELLVAAAQRIQAAGRLPFKVLRSHVWDQVCTARKMGIMRVCIWWRMCSRMSKLIKQRDYFCSVRRPSWSRRHTKKKKNRAKHWEKLQRAQQRISRRRHIIMHAYLCQTRNNCVNSLSEMSNDYV